MISRKLGRLVVQCIRKREFPVAMRLLDDRGWSERRREEPGRNKAVLYLVAANFPLNTSQIAGGPFFKALLPTSLNGATRWNWSRYPTQMLWRRRINFTARAPAFHIPSTQALPGLPRYSSNIFPCTVLTHFTTLFHLLCARTFADFVLQADKICSRMG